MLFGKMVAILFQPQCINTTLLFLFHFGKPCYNMMAGPDILFITQYELILYILVNHSTKKWYLEDVIDLAWEHITSLYY